MTKTFIKIGAQKLDAADYEAPIDRTFREAWQLSGHVIGVNMDQARDIWRDKIRQARVGVFESLDAQFMQAMETGADTSDIVAQKNALRDAPADPAIDAATTPEELKQVQPAGLTVE